MIRVMKNLLFKTIRIIGTFWRTLNSLSSFQHSQRPASSLVTRLIVKVALPSLEMFQCLRWLKSWNRNETEKKIDNEWEERESNCSTTYQWDWFVIKCPSHRSTRRNHWTRNVYLISWIDHSSDCIICSLIVLKICLAKN